MATLSVTSGPDAVASMAPALKLPNGTVAPPRPWPAITLRGEGPLWLGPTRDFRVMRSVKAALDPQNRYPNLDE
jgi:hypothetical protein